MVASAAYLCTMDPQHHVVAVPLAIVTGILTFLNSTVMPVAGRVLEAGFAAAAAAIGYGVGKFLVQKYLPRIEKNLPPQD